MLVHVQLQLCARTMYLEHYSTRVFSDGRSLLLPVSSVMELSSDVIIHI